jgi:hypothetical protein
VELIIINGGRGVVADQVGDGCRSLRWAFNFVVVVVFVD